MSSTNTPSAPKRGAGSKHKEMFILPLVVLLASSSTTPTMNWLTSSGAAKTRMKMIPQIISQLFLQTGNSLESTLLESKFYHGLFLAVGPSIEIHISRLDDQKKRVIRNALWMVKITWQSILSIGIYAIMTITRQTKSWNSTKGKESSRDLKRREFHLCQLMSIQISVQQPLPQSTKKCLF